MLIGVRGREREIPNHVGRTRGNVKVFLFGDQRFRIILHLPQRRQFHYATTVATHRVAVHVMEGTRLVRRACADNASRWGFPSLLLAARIRCSHRSLSGHGGSLPHSLLRPADQPLGHKRHPEWFGLRRACSRSRIISVASWDTPCMIAAFSARQAARRTSSEKLLMANSLVMPARDIGRRRRAAPCTWACSSLPVGTFAQKTVRVPIINDNIILSSQAT